MQRVWLWLVVIGGILILLAVVGWLAGKAEWWHTLIGLNVLITGLNLGLRRRRRPASSHRPPLSDKDT